MMTAMEMELELFRRRARIVAIDCDNNRAELTEKQEIRFRVLIASAQKKLEEYGYILTTNVVRHLYDVYSSCIANSLKRPEEIITEALKSVITAASVNIGAHVDYKTTVMYKGFPNEVMEMEEAELYFNAFIHYFTAGHVFPESINIDRFPLIEYEGHKLQPIELAYPPYIVNEAVKIFKSNVAMPPHDKEYAMAIVKEYGKFYASIFIHNLFVPMQMTVKENIATAVFVLYDKVNMTPNFMHKLLPTATDVLRFVTCMCSGDVSLAENSSYNGISRPERRLIMKLLSRTNNLEEDMLRHKSKWIRLGEVLHPFEYKDAKYDNVVVAFTAIRNNNSHIETFNSKSEKAIQSKDVDQITEILSLRPGEFVRKLDRVLRETDNVADQHTILAKFAECLSRSNVPVATILQLKEHFKNRDTEAARFIMPKSNTSKLVQIPELSKHISVDTSSYVVSICDSYIYSTARNKPFLGKVFIDKDLKDYTVPLNLRSTTKSLKTIARGSKISNIIDDDHNIIRSFVYWKDDSATKGQEGRVDLDLSVQVLDDEYNPLESCAYFNLKAGSMMHSGDIVAAPHGASEFIDINIDKLRLEKPEARYAVISINSFTNQKLNTVPECFAGIMVRDSIGSGEIYEPKTVKYKFDLNTDAVNTIPMIIDVIGKVAYWVDMSYTRKAKTVSNNVIENANAISMICKSIIETPRPNLYGFFTLQTEPRSIRVYNPEEADVVYTTGMKDLTVSENAKVITPFDIDIITTEYL